MAYSELVKNIERIRDYMREFYVFGFKSRDEYDTKSARSYDNERRRIESWLGEYMSFRQDASGKNVFLSVDSRNIPRNPLYKAFKAKSFTAKDITLHFYILDILRDGEAMTTAEIVEEISKAYLPMFNTDFSFDESTVRKKLKEYEELGILVSQKSGREVRYQRNDNPDFDLSSWSDALAFFAEENPVGVIGSYLQDKEEHPLEVFGFKHHYMLHALDSDILCKLLEGINERRAVDLTVRTQRSGVEHIRTLCPLKIYVSTQSGREYLLGYFYRGRRLQFLRLDSIKDVKLGSVEKKYDKYLGYQEKFDLNLWGTSSGNDLNLDHVEMIIHFGRGEEFILQRLERERRHGVIEILDQETCKFTADVYDATEMLPWIRTFIGRIVDLKCSSQYVVDTFYEDLEKMKMLYVDGGDDDAVS